MEQYRIKLVHMVSKRLYQGESIKNLYFFCSEMTEYNYTKPTL